MRRYLAIATACGVGCAPLSAPERLVDPCAACTGDDGTDGPFGAALTTFDLQVRLTDARHVDVVIPADPLDGPLPVVVFLHGGFVPEDRYRWFGEHLATRGYVTVLPHHELSLAILEPGNGAAALDEVIRLAGLDGNPLTGLVSAHSAVATAGHSLGGVLAARQWLVDPEVDGLILLASEPAPGDPVEDGGTRPVLSLVGSEDGKIDADAVADAARRFVGPTFVGVVDGMNHYDWTDDAKPGELASDNPSTRPLAAARTDAWRLIDAWLDGVLVDGDPTPPDGPFPGIAQVAP